MKALKGIFAVSLLFLLCGAGLAVASDWQGRDRDGYYQDNRSNSRWYREGLRDGREDRARRRPANYRYTGRSGPQREEYIAGYREGYGAGYVGGGRDRDHDGIPDNQERGRNGGYGTGGYGTGGYGSGQYGNGQYGNNTYLRQAYQYGYEDGQRMGASDRATGHSYRPTEQTRYRDGDRGWNSSIGNKPAYQQAFRQGFQAGYDLGYRR